MAAGNNFLVGELRVDQTAISEAKDYRHYVAGRTPDDSPGGAFVTAWLGIDLDDESGLYGAKFTQVGILATEDGIQWFVYSEAGVDCLVGDEEWNGLGCVGDVDDIVEENTYHQVELVTYAPTDDFWIARVYDDDGNATDVAEIDWDEIPIYRAQATFEEAWSGTSDPDIEAEFWHWHPEYMSSSGSWTAWSATSGSNKNYLWDYPNNTFCNDDYGAEDDLNSDDRSWYTGSPTDTTVTYQCDIDPLF